LDTAQAQVNDLFTIVWGFIQFQHLDTCSSNRECLWWLQAKTRIRGCWQFYSIWVVLCWWF